MDDIIEGTDEQQRRYRAITGKLLVVGRVTPLTTVEDLPPASPGIEPDADEVVGTP